MLGFYKGMIPTLIKAGVLTVLYFGVYEKIKQIMWGEWEWEKDRKIGKSLLVFLFFFFIFEGHKQARKMSKLSIQLHKFISTSIFKKLKYDYPSEAGVGQLILVSKH